MPHDQISNFKNDGFESLKPSTPPQGADWMRSHPWAFSVYGAIIVLIIGAVYLTRKDTTPRGGVTAWGGDTVVVDTGVYIPPPTPLPPKPESTTIVEDLSHNDPPFSIPTAVPEVPTSSPPPFDLGEFLQRLNPGTTPKPPSTKTTQSAADLIREAYSYVPGGLVGIKSTQDGRTELQQTLFEYGNEIGAHVQSFEDQYPNSITILKDQAEDRGNPAKVDALERYATSMKDVGARMMSVSSVPAEVSSAHEKLARSYIAIGTKLSLVAKTRSDADFLHAIEEYNTAVEAHIKEFVGMATLFGAFEVHFGTVDAGRVFTFTPASL